MNDDQATQRKRPYSIDEAASELGLCRNTIYRLAASGELPTIRLGKRMLVPAPALHALLEGKQ